MLYFRLDEKSTSLFLTNLTLVIDFKYILLKMMWRDYQSKSVNRLSCLNSFNFYGVLVMPKVSSILARSRKTPFFTHAKKLNTFLLSFFSLNQENIFACILLSVKISLCYIVLKCYCSIVTLHSSIR